MGTYRMVVTPWVTLVCGLALIGLSFWSRSGHGRNWGLTMGIGAVGVVLAVLMFAWTARRSRFPR